MADPQPPTVVEGATTGDVEDEIPALPKSAEDRKAAAALSSLDTRREDEAVSTKNVDQDAVKKAMDRLAGTGAQENHEKKEEQKEVRKVVKIDQADVIQIMDQLDLTKAKASDLLKAHDGDAVTAMKAFLTVSV
ncbi:MAG: hypothetical protein M1818_002958 [Claussenomyces sp. TS43310]|nr:MAG: hypothetical protein M1818_002958 [Claussenomyces sp. TS43310]